MAHLQHIIVSLEGPEETRGARVLVPDIFHIIWSWGLSCISVGSPLFFIFEGLFTMYYSVV